MNRVKHLELMIAMLRDSSDIEVKVFLARLRCGESVEDVVNSPQADVSMTGYTENEFGIISPLSPSNHPLGLFQ